MKTLLRIDTSARLEGSHSRKLGDYFQKKWSEHNPTGKIILRDLAKEVLPQLSNQEIKAFHDPKDRDESITALSDELIAELIVADEILITSPLYNFFCPSSLKAYIDLVVRSGKTFRYVDGSSIGVLFDKKATLITTRGGLSNASVSDDFQTEYLKAILGFIGVPQVANISVEGTVMEEPIRSQQMRIAKMAIWARFHGANSPEWIGEFSTLDKQSLSFLRHGQAVAIINADAEAYADLCTEGVSLMIPGHNIITGKQKLLDIERKLFNEISFTSFEKYPTKIERNGDVAVEIGVQKIKTSNALAKSGILASEQKYMHVFKLTPEGWRFSSLMSNSNE